ncbi:MAG: amino acid ABC transporter permease [Armatimonadota bacterium]|nr:amino acid ABC transporter permease [Armatimonadota bacterium]MDR7437120.1 amino acid ABC transporter permease [Armatimonadota bacterium]MDR7472465.1 amino acid ABC transporter permease [Armatimonadota bacterium]MDR7507968.1 amino acid ABC transporter permease [Armatimonadota bacterium]MDR7510194.1 amino acid ABC transporter permease [Armatimonadota bacterium]
MATRADVLAAPAERLTVREWARRNLFDGVANSLLTVLTAAGVLAAAASVARWAARAHWAVVTENLRFWLVGLMPVELVWRAYWAGGLVVAMAALTVLGLRAGVAGRRLAGAWAGVLVGAGWVMSPVRLDQVGGLYLTVLLAAVAIGASFPIGVVVGIGRVSRLPVVRALATVYIEVIRGVPFITVLLWFSVFVTLVSGDALSRVQRAMVAMTVFTSAYVAEIVRGGIQSVSRGQVEAARALGLSGWQTMRTVVLPQAITNMIPALVGQFISLFKDTSLAVIIGLSELVGTGRALLAITRYLHDVQEVYVFLLVVYFAFTSILSAASRRLEKAMGLGER